MKKSICCLYFLYISILAVTILEASPKTETRTFLDNGRVKVGCDLALGGAITYLATPAKDNLVNSWDLGRQIQMSYYSGPSPLIIKGKRPAPMWANLGWNPIQSGDHFRNPSRVVKHRNDGKTIYVKTVPMLWPHDNIPAECTFEMWVTLDGQAVHLRCRLTNHRSDHTLYPGRDQELPAVYLNGAYHRLLAYTGDRPFTGAALTRIVKKPGSAGPWSYFSATENWAALVDENDFGVGVWNPGRYRFVGGFAGKPGKGGPHDTATGYVAPLARLLLDHDIRHEYRCTLVVGSLGDIRKHVRGKSSSPRPPLYRFRSDRQGWTHTNVRDAGWPIKGDLNLTLKNPAPELTGPPGFWFAKDAPRLGVEAAVRTRARQARLFWATHDKPDFDARRSTAFDIIGDGKYRSYVVPLAGLPGYAGAITQLRLDPIVGGTKGDEVRVKAIGFVPAK